MERGDVDDTACEDGDPRRPEDGRVERGLGRGVSHRGDVPISASPRVDHPRSVDESIEAAIEAADYRRALALCVEEHGAAIGRVCMALVGSQGEADDLTQETFLAAHGAFSSWKREGTIRAWLVGIARKKCLKYIEKQRRQDRRLRLVAPREGAAPEDLVALRQKAEQARAALGAIRPTEREALLLRYVGQLTFAEVARACDIEEPAARKRVSRALMRLKQEVEEKDHD